MRPRALPMLLLAASLVATPLALAKPKDATGLCKDGSYTRDHDRATACGGHRGLKTWYGKKKTAKAAPAQAEPGDVRDLRPDKPAQTDGDRRNNTQPTDGARR